MTNSITQKLSTQEIVCSLIEEALAGEDRFDKTVEFRRYFIRIAKFHDDSYVIHRGYIGEIGDIQVRSKEEINFILSKLRRVTH